MSNGRFVWHDLYSTDVEKSIAFYTELLGWTVDVRDMGEHGKYSMVMAGETGVGGVSPLQPGDKASHWISYATVGDVNAAVAQVRSLGGTIDSEPFAVPDVGTMAFARDVEGARFAPFQAIDPDYVPPVLDYAAKAGTATWHELFTSDTERAIAFYSAIFGWEHVAWDMGEFVYHGMTIDGTPEAGIWGDTETSDPSAWKIYFEVPGSIDDAIAAIPKLGGSVTGEKANVPGTGDFVLAKDPGGAVFGLLKSEPM